jgi:hypothetical protein
LQNALCGLVLLRPKTQVQISIRAQTPLRVEPGDCPTLDQHWLNASRAKKPEDFFD